MPTQAEIAAHFGISQPAVSKQLQQLGVDWKKATLTEVRHAYIAHLTAVAAGHRSADGMDLTHERALTERVDREIKELTLAEKRGLLVNLSQLEPELVRQYTAFKLELEARDDKLKDELDTLYGIDVDLQLLTTHTRNALAHLTRHDGSGEDAAASAAPGGGSDGDDVDDGLGNGAAPAQSEGNGKAG